MSSSRGQLKEILNCSSHSHFNHATHFVNQVGNFTMIICCEMNRMKSILKVHEAKKGLMRLKVM
jgi:fluoride ion exporter CrcB/FEX